MSSENNFESNVESDFEARLNRAIDEDTAVYRIEGEPNPCEDKPCVYQGAHEQKQCPADKGHEDACAFGTIFAVAKQPCGCKGDGSCEKEGSCGKKCCCKAPRLIQIEGIQK